MTHESKPEKKFTVFSNRGFQGNATQKYDGLGLHEFVAAASCEFHCECYVVWAPELPDYYEGGTKSVSALRAESIAAGRVIKQIDGKYVPCVGGEPIPQFYVSAKTLEPQPEPQWVIDARARVAAKRAADSTYEPLRDPLPSLDAGRFDPFKGWLVNRSDTYAVEPRHTLQRSPDLEPSSAQVGPAFGSAYLLKAA